MKFNVGFVLNEKFDLYDLYDDNMILKWSQIATSCKIFEGKILDKKLLQTTFSERSKRDDKKFNLKEHLHILVNITKNI